MAVEVKICGLTTPADVEAVNAAGADYAGFVFYEKSKRRIGNVEAEHLLALLDPAITSVAVCVSPDAEQVARIEALGFAVIQIHGEIAPELLETVRIPVWQAINLSDCAQLDQILVDQRIDGYLIDGAAFGGGKTFGWEQAAGTGSREENTRNGSDGVTGSSGRHVGGHSAGSLVTETLGDEIRQRINGQRLILAGGLTPENVSEGIRLFMPDVVDVSSGVEWAADETADAVGVQRGRKDPAKIMKFVREVREL